MPLPFRQKRDMIILVSMPACRNGRRGRLKICCGQPRAGSSPAAGIKILEKNRLQVGSFFTRVANKGELHGTDQ